METTKTVQVIVGSNTYVVDTELLSKYPESVLSTAFRFNHQKHTLNFEFHDSEYFDIVLGIYLHDRIRVPDGLTTYKKLREDLLFWGFDIADPICLSPTLKPPQTSLVWPWGMWASTIGNSRWIPISCTFLELILTCAPVILAASLGYRNVHIYVKHRFDNDNIGISLVVSRNKFIQKLAELNACYIEFLDGVYGNNITREARVQDVLCNNEFTVPTWTYMTHHELDATCMCRGINGLIIKANQPQCINVSYRGFSVQVSINSSEMTWDCKSTTESDEPLLLEDTRGFVFRLSFVVNHTELEDIRIPACDWILHKLKFQLSKATTYDTDNPLWFQQNTLPPKSQVQPTNVSLTTDDASVFLVVYRAESIKLNAKHVHYHENQIDESAYYERMLLSW